MNGDLFKILGEEWIQDPDESCVWLIHHTGRFEVVKSSTEKCEIMMRCSKCAIDVTKVFFGWTRHPNRWKSCNHPFVIKHGIKYVNDRFTRDDDCVINRTYTLDEAHQWVNDHIYLLDLSE